MIMTSSSGGWTELCGVDDFTVTMAMCNGGAETWTAVVCVASWACAVRMGYTHACPRLSCTHGRRVGAREICDQPAVGWFTNLL